LNSHGAVCYASAPDAQGFFLSGAAAQKLRDEKRRRIIAERRRAGGESAAIFRVKIGVRKINFRRDIFRCRDLFLPAPGGKK
jgi:hypothetical protein